MPVTGNGLAVLASLATLVTEIPDAWVTMGTTYYKECELCSYRHPDVEDRDACCKCPNCGRVGKDYDDPDNCPDCSRCGDCGNDRDDCSCCPDCGKDREDYGCCGECEEWQCCSCACDCGGCTYCPDCGGHHCQTGGYCDSCEEYACNCCCVECSVCDEKPCACPHVNEREVAQRLGLRLDLNVAQKCADYYLLLNLWQRYKEPLAFEKLGELAEDLVPEFELYLDMAIGGEMRHAEVDLPDEYRPPVQSRTSSRGLAWERWMEWGTPLQRMLAAHAVFKMEIWDGAYGGEKWADIAMTLKMRRVPNPLDPIKWLDRVWNLQHNGGCALNKIYPVDKLTYVLNAHGKDDYNLMLQYCSDEVKTLWFTVRDWRKLYSDYAIRVKAGLDIGDREAYKAPLMAVLSEFKPKERVTTEWSDDHSDYIHVDNNSEIIDHWTNTRAFRNWATTTGG